MQLFCNQTFARKCKCNARERNTSQRNANALQEIAHFMGGYIYRVIYRLVILSVVAVTYQTQTFTTMLRCPCGLDYTSRHVVLLNIDVHYTEVQKHDFHKIKLSLSTL